MNRVLTVNLKDNIINSLFNINIANKDKEFLIDTFNIKNKTEYITDTRKRCINNLNTFINFSKIIK